jgi:histidine triad (HIT) family protein
MTDDCIFCRIVDGEIPNHTVSETDGALAFLDANPLSRGHTLVIPKTHFERLGDLTPEAAHHLYELLHEVVPAVENAVDADASTVAFNNGEAAGQEVPHVHAHIVPRFEGDGGRPIHALVDDRPDMDDDDLAAVADDIANER